MYVENDEEFRNSNIEYEIIKNIELMNSIHHEGFFIQRNL
jgi:hypothetical protein